MLTEELRYFLKKKEFIHIATCNQDGHPNVAPKFLIRVDEDCIYLADFVLGRTHDNLKLKTNSKVSLSTIDLESLVGYQMNGEAHLVESGPEFDELVKALGKREAHFSATRIIEGLHQERKQKSFEIAFPEKVVVIKIEIEEVVNIAASGKVERDQKKKTKKER